MNNDDFNVLGSPPKLPRAVTQQGEAYNSYFLQTLIYKRCFYNAVSSGPKMIDHAASSVCFTLGWCKSTLMSSYSHTLNHLQEMDLWLELEIHFLIFFVFVEVVFFFLFFLYAKRRWFARACVSQRKKNTKRPQITACAGTYKNQLRFIHKQRSTWGIRSQIHTYLDIVYLYIGVQWSVLPGADGWYERGSREKRRK